MSEAKPATDKTVNKRSRGRPRLDDVADIENVLLDVALKEFLEHGYGGASISRIVKNARMSKTTFYSRFDSKETLFHAIIEKQIGQLEPERILSSASGALDLEQGLTDYANHMLELGLKGEYLGVNRLLYSESHRFTELASAAASRNSRGIKRISDFIQDCAAAEGSICRDARSVAEMFIFTIRGWYIDIMLTSRKVTPKERKQWVGRMVQLLLSSRSSW